jgi:hypothetical protein
MVCRYALRQHAYCNHSYITTITNVQLLHQYIHTVEMVNKNTIHNVLYVTKTLYLMYCVVVKESEL